MTKAIAAHGWRKSARWPGELPAAEQMEMDVEDRLSRTGARVHDGAIAGGDPLRSGNLRGGEHEPAHHRGIRRLVERSDVLLRDHEDVRRRLRIDVAEGDRVLVLADDLRRDLPAHDAAEQAGVGHVVFSSARVSASAAMAAVSNRRTLVPSDAPRQPPSSKASRSAGSKPPSGPSARTTGAWAVARMSGIGRPRSSSTIAPPVAT